MTEEWRAVEGYEDLYEVSSFGRVRSLDRIIQRAGQKAFVLPGRILKTRLHPAGYVYVDLNSGHNPQSFRLHRLVAKAFLPNPENFPDVDHRDGVRNNNAVGNLKWSTEKDNLLSRHNIKQASGFRGVRKQSRTPGDQYQAYCHDHVAGKFVHIGVYPTAEAASAARAAYISEHPNVSTR